MNNAITVLAKGLKRLDIALENDKVIAYLELLQKWNKALNLTAIDNMDEMVVKHVLDSLSIAPFIKGENILDIGTGAGFPGIPLALAYPKKKFTLLDSNSKKTRFLFEVVRLLSLNNVTIVHERVEKLNQQELFDVITSRAFSDLKKMLLLSRHLLKKEGFWLAMKGDISLDELNEINAYSYEILNLKVPALDAKRSCIVIKNN